MRINTNLPAMRAVRAMGELQASLAASLRRLASGQRINEARDDAAGLAISQNLTAQVRGLRAVALNINQAFGYLQTADGILQTQTELVQRMRELALQGANGTISATNRKMLETELLTLVEEFDRVSKQAQFNGTNLLDGTFETVNIQVGLHKGETLGFSLPDSRASAIFTNIRTVGTGNFSLGSSHDFGTQPFLFANPGDVNGDGFNDQVVADINNNTWLGLNDGNGNFSWKKMTNGVGSINFADFNGDGRKDYWFTSGNSTSIYLQDSNGNFNQTQTFANKTAIGAIDLDGDGDLDLYEGIGLLKGVILNDGYGTFTNMPNEIKVSNKSFADLNGDGLLDVYEIDGLNNSVVYQLQSSPGRFNLLQTLNMGTGFTNIRSGDFNGDGIMDFIASHSSSGDISVRLGNLSGTFSATATVSLGANFVGLYNTGDINNDGFDDFLALNDGANQVAVRLSNGDGTFSSGTTISNPNLDVSYINQGLLVDMDQDGFVDFVNGSGTQAEIFYGDGRGNFSDAITAPIETYYGLNAVDINNDGLLDLSSPSAAFQGQGSNSTFSLQGPHRAFANSTQVLAGPLETSQLVGVADYNGDGVLDFWLADDFNLTQGTSIFTMIQNTREEEDATKIEMKSQEDAQNLLAVFDRALQKLNSRRAAIGATSNRLEYALNNSLTMMENLSSARSQIMDLDMASEVAELTRLQILQQAQASVLGQANFSLRMALDLLEPPR